MNLDLSKLTVDEQVMLGQLLEHRKYDWHLHARPNQKIPKGRWNTWLLIAGRGFGKTRTGVETVRYWQERGSKYMTFVAPTSSDARRVMVKGESGILACSPSWNMPHFSPTNNTIVWPNGATANITSSEEPDRLRGLQHEKVWIDELASCNNAEEMYDMLKFGHRLGKPQSIITGTPRPIKIIKDLLNNAVPHDEMTDDSVADVVFTRGSTYENSDNLAQEFINDIRKKYAGTRIGEQEVHAAVLGDNPTAIFFPQHIESNRIIGTLDPYSKQITNVRLAHSGVELLDVNLTSIFIAVDPAMTRKRKSNLTGIIVVGFDGENGYVFKDSSGRYTPSDWSSIVVQLYYEYNANAIIVETNQGGDLISNNILAQDEYVNIKTVSASKGKVVRAEPVATLYEQGRIYHLGTFKDLETEMFEFSPIFQKSSPDRLDALVWGVTAGLVKQQKFWIA